MADVAVEPWLRQTLTGIEPVRRQVLHALQHAEEDVARWCAPLTEEELAARPFGLASVAFHLRHIARSLDRLLTYAEGAGLSEAQREQLREFREGMERARERILKIAPEMFAEIRGVGTKQIAVPVAGILIHCAEHTQRHAGQAVTTAKVVVRYQD